MMRHLIAPLTILSLLLAACATRATASFQHGPIAESQLLHDKTELEKASGVDQVIIRHALDGTATLQIYAKQGDLTAAETLAAELGWTKIRN